MEHTGASGDRTSSPITGNVTSQIVGYSTRYNGGSVELGQTAWVYLNGSPVKLGFIDAEHTALDGSKNTWVTEIRANGYISGNSNRYNGDSLSQGESAWVFLPGTQTMRRLGFRGGIYTREDGYEFSGSRFISDNLLLGTSDRFQLLNPRGSAVWIHNIQANSTTQIGFTDAEHTASDNTQYSYSQGITNGTSLVGYSNRYSGLNYLGTTAWTYSLGTNNITKIGLTDAEHTATDGTRSNLGWQINSQGVVAGTADRYDAVGAAIGVSAWLYKPSSNTTIEISVTGPAYLTSGGFRQSTVNYLTDSGLAFGSAIRYTGDNYNGTSLFVYDLSNSST